MSKWINGLKAKKQRLPETNGRFYSKIQFLKTWLIVYLTCLVLYSSTRELSCLSRAFSVSAPPTHPLSSWNKTIVSSSNNLSGIYALWLSKKTHTLIFSLPTLIFAGSAPWRQGEGGGTPQDISEGSRGGDQGGTLPAGLHEPKHWHMYCL